MPNWLLSNSNCPAAQSVSSLFRFCESCSQCVSASMVVPSSIIPAAASLTAPFCIEITVFSFAMRVAEAVISSVP